MSVKQALSDALGGVQGNTQPRGLHNFIQEIRHCSNAAEEQVGILANTPNAPSACASTDASAVTRTYGNACSVCL